MAFYMFGDYIREQRERMGVTQEDLCEGICSPGTLSKIENGRQGVRLNQYIALMERLGLPVQPMGVQVTEEEMRITCSRFDIDRTASVKLLTMEFS